MRPRPRRLPRRRRRRNSVRLEGAARAESGVDVGAWMGCSRGIPVGGWVVGTTGRSMRIVERGATHGGAVAEHRWWWRLRVIVCVGGRGRAQVRGGRSGGTPVRGGGYRTGARLTEGACPGESGCRSSRRAGRSSAGGKSSASAGGIVVQKLCILLSFIQIIPAGRSRSALRPAAPTRGAGSAGEKRSASAGGVLKQYSIAQ